MTTIGYNAVIPFNWLMNSSLKGPGVTQLEGGVLEKDIISAADSLVQTKGTPGHVVDLHLIGHSRGSVVISQALINLSGSRTGNNRRLQNHDDVRPCILPTIPIRIRTSPQRTIYSSEKVRRVSSNHFSLSQRTPRWLFRRTSMKLIYTIRTLQPRHLSHSEPCGICN